MRWLRMEFAQMEQISPSLTLKQRWQNLISLRIRHILFQQMQHQAQRGLFANTRQFRKLGNGILEQGTG
jgi:hypothetical protein